MRIQELLENKDFDDMKFVKKTGDKREIDYDLSEDLIHFMHNDDDVYRRLLFPKIAHVMDRLDLKQPTHLKIFKPAVEHSYKIYVKKFPIRELPDELDDKMLEQICNKLHTDTLKDIKDGAYKD